MKPKILVVTGTRADYGLLSHPIKAIIAQGKYDLSLAVTGTHLSNAHGHTIDEIAKDNFPISVKVDLEIKGDSPSDICKYIAKGIQGFSEAFSNSKPDLLLVLGDRYEIFSAVSAAMIHNIPVAHIHGGEATWGCIDDSIRHSITKMSQIHFTSTQLYADRVIQMGEKPSHVFAVGAPGLDLLKSIQTLSKEELEAKLGSPLGAKNVVVTYHPVTLDKNKTKEEVDNLFKALRDLPSEYKVWVGMPNADTYSDIIRGAVNSFIKDRPTSQSFENLGSKAYSSMMKFCDLIIGNSSSGIIEAPFFGKAIIDIGLRQDGRLADKNVIRVLGGYEDMKAAILKSVSPEFTKTLSPSVLYGTGDSSKKIADALATISLDNIIMKGFYDLN